MADGTQVLFADHLRHVAGEKRQDDIVFEKPVVLHAWQIVPYGAAPRALTEFQGCAAVGSMRARDSH